MSACACGSPNRWRNCAGIVESLRVKAAGYVTKSEPAEALVRAIKRVARGRVYFSPQVQARIVADAGDVRLGTRRTRHGNLTSRELEVLCYLARGLSKKQTAQTMHISVKTVEGHAAGVMNKLGIHDRVELTRYAIRKGLVQA